MSTADGQLRRVCCCRYADSMRHEVDTAFAMPFLALSRRRELFRPLCRMAAAKHRAYEDFTPSKALQCLPASGL
jgi:hypothetical protein